MAVTTDRAAAVRPLLIGGDGDRVLRPAVGTVREIAEQLRERYGFTYLSVLDPYMEEFGPVIEGLRGT